MIGRRRISRPVAGYRMTPARWFGIARKARRSVVVNASCPRVAQCFCRLSDAISSIRLPLADRRCPPCRLTLLIWQAPQHFTLMPAAGLARALPPPPLSHARLFGEQDCFDGEKRRCSLGARRRRWRDHRFAFWHVTAGTCRYVDAMLVVSSVVTVV